MSADVELGPLGVDVWYAVHFPRGGGPSRWEVRRVADPERYFTALRVEYAGRGVVERFDSEAEYAEAIRRGFRL